MPVGRIVFRRRKENIYPASPRHRQRCIITMIMLPSNILEGDKKSKRERGMEHEGRESTKKGKKLKRSLGAYL